MAPWLGHIHFLCSIQFFEEMMVQCHMSLIIVCFSYTFFIDPSTFIFPSKQNKIIPVTTCELPEFEIQSSFSTSKNFCFHFYRGFPGKSIGGLSLASVLTPQLHKAQMQVMMNCYAWMYQWSLAFL